MNHTMDRTPILLETPLPPEVVLQKLEAILRSNRSLRFARRILAGRVAGGKVLLWRDRRNGQSALYPALHLTVRPNGSGATLQAQFGYNSRAILVAGVVGGTIGGLLAVAFALSEGATPMVAAGAALLAVFVLPPFFWVSALFWVALLSGDRELLLRELKDALRDEGV